MANPDILEQAAVKKADLSAIADRLIGRSDQISKVIEALQTEKSSRKFAYEKTLRLISERRPDLIYPYFDFFVKLLDSDNSFLKWGAIISVANLTTVDADKKFEAVFPKYFAPIRGPEMITASNIIGSSATIARAKLGLVDPIAKEILKVERARFFYRGVLSPECRNVAIGHAIDSLDKFYGRIGDPTEVMEFVRRQLGNTRSRVVGKAERFIKNHSC